MTIKNSLAKKKFWESFSKKERFSIMSERTKKGWASKTKQQRAEHIQLMNKARLKKLIQS